MAVLLLVPAVSAGNAYDSVDGGDATGWNTQRKVARAADGAVFWTYLAPDASGYHSEVVVVREAPDGSLTELPRPRGALGDVSRSTLVLDAEGRLHVAWTERAEDDREVFHAIFEDGAWSSAVQLSTGRGYAGFPSLAVGPDGAVHVAWYGFDGTHYQAFYRSWAEGAWSEPVQLSSGELDANNPSVLVDAEARVHVVWYKDDGHRYRVWHAVAEPGAGFSLPRGLTGGDGEDVNAFNAALAMDAAGFVHVVWDERRSDGLHVMHATWNATRGWAEARSLASGADAGEYPAIAAWKGGVLVAWARQDGTLVGTDLSEAPRPLLGGVMARNPSLRGPMPAPASERAAALDLLYATKEGGAWRVVHAVLPEACSVFAPLSECGDATRVAVDPATAAQTASVARAQDTPGFALAAVVAALAFTARWRSSRR